jgi:hypothetical protein
MAPPATPNDRLQILRKAFMETWRDPELIAEAKKLALTSNLRMAPSSNRTSRKCSSSTRHRSQS